MPKGGGKMTNKELYAFAKSLNAIVKAKLSDEDKVKIITEITDGVIRETSSENPEKEN
jgi:hypothetical protein